MDDAYNTYNLVLVKYITNGYIYRTNNIRTDKNSKFRGYLERNSDCPEKLVDHLNTPINITDGMGLN